MKKNLTIGSTVSFIYNDIRLKGNITDVLELGNNDNVYVAETDMGVYHLNNIGEPIMNI